jgi:response regulator of citrate/malate metabolism
MISKTQFDINEKKKLLLIDDCQVTLKLMKFIINKIDKDRIYEINTLTHLDKELLNNQTNIQKMLKYDMIITDYHIGYNNCTVLIDMLKSNNYNGKIYCVTGNEDPNITNELLSRNINGIFFKPLSFENIQNMLNLNNLNSSTSIKK